MKKKNLYIFAFVHNSFKLSDARMTLRGIFNMPFLEYWRCGAGTMNKILKPHIPKCWGRSASSRFHSRSLCVSFYSDMNVVDHFITYKEQRKSVAASKRWA